MLEPAMSLSIHFNNLTAYIEHLCEAAPSMDTGEGRFRSGETLGASVKRSRPLKVPVTIKFWFGGLALL